MTDDDTPARVEALARDLDRTTRRVADLTTLLGQLATDLTALAEPTPDGADTDTDGGVRAWLLVEDPDQARTDLTDLVEWLHRVYLRYPDTALPSCWLWHPTVVEELWWLRNAHTDAYTGTDASWTRAGDWHDRQRPGVVKRLRTTVAGCELALHAAGAEHAHSPTAAPLGDAAEQIAQAWTADGRYQPPPEPTPVQLAEADQHDRRRGHR